MSIQRIDRASVATINSGQVIVDLCSAIKELVENAIDSGTASVDVRLEEHGTALIEVADTGCGIDAADYASVGLRSHTSKLSSFDGLDQVTSLGFRGEALNSLCNLAQLSMETATAKTAPKGVELTFDAAGQVTGQRTVPRKMGTTVRARNLFHKIPVRQRDLEKNAKREFTKVVSLLHAYALGQPSIRFSLSNKVGKKTTQGVIRTQGKGSLMEVFGTLFGNKSASGMLSYDLSCQVTAEKTVLRVDGLQHAVFDVRASGLISKPDEGCGRSASDRQFFFLNGRPFSPAKLQKGVNEAYKAYNLLQSPAIVLHLELPPSVYDVNVNPDKRTILFHSEFSLIDAIKEELGEFLLKARARFEREESLVPEVAPAEADLAEASRPATPPAPNPPGSAPWPQSSPANDEAVQPGEKPSQNTFAVSGRPHKRIKLDPDADETPPPAPAQAIDVDVDREDIDQASPQPDHDLDDQESDAMHHDGSSDVGDVVDEEVEEPPPRVFDTSNASWAAAATSWKGPTGHGKPDIQLIQGQLPFQARQRTRSPVLQVSLSDSEGETEGAAENPRPARQPSFIVHEMLQPASSFDPPMAEDESDLSIDTALLPREEDSSEVLDEAEAASLLEEIEEAVSQPLRSRTIGFDMDAIARTWQHRASAKAVKIAPVLLDAHDASMDAVQRDAEATLSRTIDQQDFRDMRICGQFNLGFIIARRTRSKDGVVEADDLFIIDQHASDEKYNFESLTASTRLESQRELVPRNLELSAIDELIAVEHSDILRANGFDIAVNEDRPAGQRVKLTGHPVSKSTVFGMPELEEILYLIKENPGARMVRPAKVRSMLASRACRKSVMIGSSLKSGQMRNILQHMGEMKQPWACPHGRPTMRWLLDLSKYD